MKIYTHALVLVQGKEDGVPLLALSIFISPPVVTAKLHTGFWVKSSTT